MSRKWSEQANSSGEVPDGDGPIVSARNDLLAVRRDTQGSNLAVPSSWNLVQKGAIMDIPNSDDPAPMSRRDYATI